MLVWVWCCVLVNIYYSNVLKELAEIVFLAVNWTFPNLSGALFLGTVDTSYNDLGCVWVCFCLYVFV